MSTAIFVFDGCAISVTAWRFRPEPIILSLALITLILTLITSIVRWRIPKEERFYLNFSAFSQFFESLRTEEKPSEIERALIIALVGSIIIASGMLVYAKITFEEEQFTAFYILGGGGKAENYTKEVYLLWEDDVAGNERWQHVNVPVTLRSATNKLTLRVYGARGSDSFPITVWWDDVTIEPVTAVGDEIATSFYILDTKGTEENYPTELYLGVPAAVRVGIKNNEHKQVNYILQMKLDGRLLTSRSKWLEPGSKWEQNISFTSDRVGERQKLEFLLFKDYVREKPYRYCHLWVSTEITYDNLEPLLRYGVDPLPAIREGDMWQVYAWTRESEYGGSFREGYHAEENTSSPCSYCIKQYRDSNKGDYMGLSQELYAIEPGVVVLSFNVRDSFEYTSDEAKDIIKQVMLDDKVIWADDVSGRDTGYVGWVKEEYVGPNWVWNERIKSHEGFVKWVGAGHDWWKDKWIKRSVPDVKSGWMHVDIPVYLWEGNNELSLRVYAKESVKNLDFWEK